MPDQSAADLLAYDRAHLWHPYTSMMSPTPTRLVTEASGVRLRLHDGSELVDAMASWWCAIHGYRHPKLDEALRRQAQSMSHVMFGGLTHEPAIGLARSLVEVSAVPLRHVFFADSGSVAVEVALKMAVQYQRGVGRPHRTRTLALRGGYHGDTLGAMSVCDPVGGMHAMFASSLPQQVFAPRPPAGYFAPEETRKAWAEEVRTIVEQRRHELAAIICEPVLQGAGGMHVYDPRCLTVLRELADEFGLVLIFDEVATGFGRTGRFFAAQHAEVTPDISCVGKALTGGYLTLAATLCTSEIAHGIGHSESGVLMHGPTFMANPLACAVARASLDLLASGQWESDVRRLQSRLRAGLEPARHLPGVAEVRVLGGVGVIQLDHTVDVTAATDAAAAEGVWLRPFRDLVYAMPAYVMADADVDRVCAAMRVAAAS